MYARVVNGIRKYFYDRSDLDALSKLRMRVLPQSPQLPSYAEIYFLPVVIVFAIINTLYAASAYFVFHSPIIMDPVLVSAIFALLFLMLHPIIYFVLSKDREISYLKSNILGIDIDGVLNHHRVIFCDLLLSKTGKHLTPNEITVIPVHEDPNKSITREDEREVFNEANYWKNMPVIQNAPDILNRLINIFGFKVYIFTYRPWPDIDDQDKLAHYKMEFIDACDKVALRDWIFRKIRISKAEPIKTITKEWLRKHDFKPDRVIFEKGNDYTSDPRVKLFNRFSIARKKKIRFFVEDDFEKAIKLSFVCDLVFLYSQPYNQPNVELPVKLNQLRSCLPSNIVRVESWSEILKYIRRLS